MLQHRCFRLRCNCPRNNTAVCMNNPPMVALLFLSAACLKWNRRQCCCVCAMQVWVAPSLLR